MSTSLTVLNNEALAAGGIGIGAAGSRLFEIKPATLEVVAKTTQQEGATPGKLRIRETGEQFDKMNLVLLVPPQEQREYYDSKTEFGSEHKVCFSLDNVEPHARAKEPQAMRCNTCSKGDINWEKWRKDKRPENLPQCRKYWHLVVADRATQMIYYFNVKGTAVRSFEQAMQNLARIIYSMEVNVKAENKAGASKPMPNIFDISFTVVPSQLEKGGPWVPQFKSFGAIPEDAKADFGNIYLDFVNRNAQDSASPEEVEASVVEAEVTEAPARTEVAAVVGAVSGTVVSKNEPIEI